MNQALPPLPPLEALRAFEAAARHLSFTAAAEELNVTQGAVSHRIRNLENRLGVNLFKRAHRQITLTEQGKAFQVEVVMAFAHLASAVRRLKETEKTGELTISVMPSFAAKWLVPRLRPIISGAHQLPPSHPEEPPAPAE